MIALAPHLRLMTDDDGGLLLDLKRNATFGMNPTTIYIWKKLEEHLPIDRIVADLTVETGENPVMLAKDVHDFLEDLRGKKMLIERAQKFRMGRTVAKALALLFHYDLCVPPVEALRRRSLWIIHQTVSKWRVAEIPASDDRCAEICKAVELACSWYPKRVKCLQRSFATAYLLRRSGIRAEFVVGGIKLPFEEHAWIEVEGRVVNDKPTFVSRFRIFERC